MDSVRMGCPLQAAAYLRTAKPGASLNKSLFLYELRFYLIITLFQALKSYTGLNLTTPQPLANSTPWIGVPLPGDITQGLRLGCPINQTSQHHPARDKLKSIAHSHYQIAGVVINPIFTTHHYGSLRLPEGVILDGWAIFAPDLLDLSFP